MLLPHLGVLPDPVAGEPRHLLLLTKFWNLLRRGGYNSGGLLSVACVGDEYLIQRGGLASRASVWSLG